MNRGLYIMVFLWIILAQGTSGQQYEPSILILSPDETSAAEELKPEIEQLAAGVTSAKTEMELELKSTLQKAEKDGKPANIKMMYRKQIEFAADLNFYSIIPLVAEGYLQHRLIHRFKNLLIYAVKEKSGVQVEELAHLAKKHEMHYIMDFPEVRSYLKNNAKRTTIRVRLYDDRNKDIILDREYTGDDRNPGFEFTCKDSTLSCTISNSLSQALAEIIDIVALNDPTIIQERNLAQERANVLESKYYTKKPDKEILEILAKNGINNLSPGYYQGLMDNKKEKLIAFFARANDIETFRDLKRRDDKGVQIIQDDFNLGKIPDIYAYVVVGVYYDSTWYLKREQVTYFNAKDLEVGRKDFFNNLQQWGFFKNNSTDFNSEFWESYFFERVKDVTKEPNYKKYYESIYKSLERDNEGYVGMYEVVADQLRKERTEEIDQFRKEVSGHLLKPYLDHLKSAKPEEFADYALMYNKFTLIFPRDKSVILNPIQITDSKGENSLRYFVWFPDTREVYEWLYLKPTRLNAKQWHYGSEIIKGLTTVTDWDFGFETLDDQNFWNTYVLAKEEGKYKYLRRIE